MTMTALRPVSAPSRADMLFPQYRPYQPAKPPLRARLEAAVERLLEIMDAMDADPDLEPDVDSELSLGWSEDEGLKGRTGSPTDDAEYSLGSVGDNGGRDQRFWTDGVGDDLEWQCEDEGEQSDRESQGRPGGGQGL